MWCRLICAGLPVGEKIMNGELTFRILFLALFVAGSAIRGYYARKMPRKDSMRERWRDTVRAEGKACATLLTAQGFYLIIIVVLYLLFPQRMLWSQLPIPDWLQWLGFGLGIASLPFLTWVQHVLGKHWSISLELREEHRLVTTGPYQRIRHPMYTVHLVYFLTWVLVSANLLLLINYLLTVILVFARIPKEEKMMLDKFGDEYRTYMKRTGRLLPHLRGKADEEQPSA